MSTYLIDTHVLLWWANNPLTISEDARIAIASPRNTLLASHATAWELHIKLATGRLSLPISINELVERARCKWLPITMEHIEATSRLPALHGDPFDRMLIAQACTNSLTLITRDKDIRKYDLPIIIA